MKFVLTALVSLMMVTPAFASNGPIGGAVANSLMAAIENTGSYSDGAMGKTYAVLQDVSCSAASLSSVNVLCDVKMQTETGDMKAVSLNGDKAEKLAMALLDAGLYTCGVESCGASLKSIVCGVANDPANGTDASCTVEQ